MKLSTRLRLISLIVLIIAVIFVACALSCPTCVMPHSIGPFRLTAEHWRTFYKLYAAAIPILFITSFLLRKK